MYAASGVVAVVLYPTMMPDRRDFVQIDEVTLARLRQMFQGRWSGMEAKERRWYTEFGMGPRLHLLRMELGLFLTEEQFQGWLYYIGITEADWEAMERGEYMPRPFFRMELSDLFGISVGFLERGDPPQPHLCGRHSKRGFKRATS